MLEGIGQFVDTVAGAVGGFFSSRETRRLEEARLNMATVARSALMADNLAKFRTVALMVFGVGAIFLLTKRARA